MEWTSFLPSFWPYALAAALLLVFWSVAFSSRTVPELARGPSLASLMGTDLGAVIDELQALGFHYQETFEYRLGKAKMLLSGCVSPDHLQLVCLYGRERRKGVDLTLEFASVFQPVGSIITSSSAAHRCAWHSMDKMFVQAPWKQSIEELFELHEELCDTATECGLFRIRFPDDGIGHVIQEELKRDFEVQTLRGYMKRLRERRYRLTLKGALLLAPRLWAKRLGAMRGIAKRRNVALRIDVEERLRSCLKVATSARNYWPPRLWTARAVR